LDLLTLDIGLAIARKAKGEHVAPLGLCDLEDAGILGIGGASRMLSSPLFSYGNLLIRMHEPLGAFQRIYNLILYVYKLSTLL
jgi:hypothetical protein